MLGDRTVTLLSLKPGQYSPVCCTASSSCWCSKLVFKVPITTIGYDVCFTPAELLESYGSELGSKDTEYLKSLLHRECIW